MASVKMELQKTIVGLSDVSNSTFNGLSKVSLSTVHGLSQVSLSTVNGLSNEVSNLLNVVDGLKGRDELGTFRSAMDPPVEIQGLFFKMFRGEKRVSIGDSSKGKPTAQFDELYQEIHS